MSVSRRGFLSTLLGSAAGAAAAVSLPWDGWDLAMPTAGRVVAPDAPVVGLQAVADLLGKELEQYFEGVQRLRFVAIDYASYYAAPASVRALTRQYGVMWDPGKHGWEAQSVRGVASALGNRVGEKKGPVHAVGAIAFGLKEPLPYVEAVSQVGVPVRVIHQYNVDLAMPQLRADLLIG